MDLGKHLQEGLLEIHLQEGQLDIHLEPQDKDEVLEVCKASPLEVAQWLGSHPLDMLDVEVVGRLLVQVVQDMQGCRQEGRQGVVGPLEGEDLMYIKAQIHT